MLEPITKRLRIHLICGVALLAWLQFACVPQISEGREPAGEKTFETDIRPILSRHCVRCHNAKSKKGGLDLTSRVSALHGGDSGPAMVPGNAAESLITEVVRYDSDVRMPPKGRLADDLVNRISAWIDRGAPWPESARLTIPADASAETSVAVEHTGPRLRQVPFALTQEDREWWSFQPIVDPPIPLVRSKDTVENAIDAFLLEKLQEKRLGFNEEASRRELIRRAYFDIVGLPPSPEAVEAFESDNRADAWERLIDSLLASPHYGERWGRHWLDLVRYADSNGYERDGEKPFAWRYRDYVIESFNADKPYDRFLFEQLAGDEMPGPFDPDRIIATGFFRLHVWDDEPDSTVTAEFDDLDDIMVTTGASMLGLTLGCARCHDHKFDPISQDDYYRFLSFFRSIDPYGQHKTGGGGRGTGRITRPLADERTIARWEVKKAADLADERAAFEKATDVEERKKLAIEIRRMESAMEPPFGHALAVYEDTVKPTFVLRRGEASAPTKEVSPGFPEIFGSVTPVIEPPEKGKTLGRRTALARWITDSSNPLTARVLVNRLWQHHFGRGLVPTPNDFGRTGEMPTHPELLDHLAADFMKGGWRIKRSQKRILMSRAYRMSSRADHPTALAADEANTHFWRQNPRRLEAEAVRDTILAVSGSLNTRMGGPGIFPEVPKEAFDSQDGARKGWPLSPPGERDRRSIYVFVKRSLTPPLLELFDSPTTTVPVGQRSVTTVAPQALTLLHDGFVRECAARLADRIRSRAGVDYEARVTEAFRLVLQRRPSDNERQSIKAFLKGDASASSITADDRFVLFCAALLNLNEVIYVD